MLGTLISLALIGGGIAFGRNFYRMIWQFLTVEVPSGWSYVSANRHFQIFQKGVYCAIGLPLAGAILTLIMARIASPAAAQIIILVTLVTAVLTQLAILIFANVFAEILIFLAPATEDQKTRLTNIRSAISGYVWLGIAAELIVVVILVLLGVYASGLVLILAALAAIGYNVTAKAYGIPITWAPRFMMNAHLIVMIGAGLVIVAFIVPYTRPYMVSLINPAKIFHSGVVDTSGFDKAEDTARRQMKILCDGNIVLLEQQIKQQMEVGEVVKKKQELAELKKICLSFKF